MNIDKIIVFVFLLLNISCAEQKNVKLPDNAGNRTNSENSSKQTQETNLTFSIIREMPHDTDAFTQGLYYLNGFLYESTGQYRKSSLRKIDAKTGQIINSVKIENSYFAEGLTIFRNKIYQLTWISNTGFIYDLKSMNQTGSFLYYGEGWGITNDDKSLIMSDGTNGLRYLNPKTFEVEKTLFVTDNNSMPVNNLNELEMVNGEIWANVWMQDYIVRINPSDGKVVAKYDLSSLKDRLTITPETDVLNGIAYDKVKGEYYVTGKNWNKIFVIKFN